jgi:hypothetical protein
VRRTSWLVVVTALTACSSDDGSSAKPSPDSGAADSTGPDATNPIADSSIVDEASALAQADASVAEAGSTVQTPDAAAGPGAPEAAVADAPAPIDSAPVDATVPNPLCNLPGSVQYRSTGVAVVPGGPSGSGTDAGPVPPLGFLSLPAGFCAHYFANVPNARQLRFAPGGELFVASPTTATTGGVGGQAAIIVLPDDNHDGFADTSITFLGSLPSTQGLLFTPGRFYYQDGTAIKSIPYAAGDRAPSGPARVEVNITIYESSLHWPKTLDIADDGTIYVGNGGDQGELDESSNQVALCTPPHPFHGGILKLDGDGGTPVAQGFRNPIAVRCQRGHNLCYATELALDYSASEGGREKIVPIRQGDDWGFPCCATTNLPYSTAPFMSDCSGVASDTDSLLIGDTPFGIDFEPGMFPGMWRSAAFVV